MQFAFTTDEDTTKLFEIVVYALTHYFVHSETAAISLVNDFYLHHPNRLEDHWYHHEGAYATAARVHYYGFLNGNDGGLDNWRRREGHWDQPPEFLGYFRANYFVNDTPPIAELWKPKHPVHYGLMSLGNEGIDKAWQSFMADGRYRLALKEDLRSPANRFGADSLNSIYAYCFGQLGNESARNYLAAIVVDTSRNDADRFGLVIFSAAENGDGGYQPHWIYQERDLSRSVVWTVSGDLIVADYKDDLSRDVSYIQWDQDRRRFVTSKSRPRARD